MKMELAGGAFGEKGRRELVACCLLFHSQSDTAFDSITDFIFFPFSLKQVSLLRKQHTLRRKQNVKAKSIPNTAKKSFIMLSHN